MSAETHLPSNAYLVRDAAQPYLVDTGRVHLRVEFLEELQKLIDLKDLRWIYLTHDHGDHIGALNQILDLAPKAKVITNSRIVIRLAQFMPVKMSRVYFLAPGEVLDIGDRTLSCVVPPFYDSPGTTAAFDSKLQTVFSSDCFGAEVRGFVDLANEFPPEELARKQVEWGTMESPWIHDANRQAYKDAVNAFRSLRADWVCSAHLPPAKGLIDRFCENVLALPDAKPWWGRSQADELAGRPFSLW